MSKPNPERPADIRADTNAAPLTPGVRRHLGQNLRVLFADTLEAPPTQRLEALLAQLAKAKR
ncbi:MULTISPECIES: hypothetical protein [Methylobacterium]|uniref:Anti-sigma factor NepR domain-containing protein n=1 Tax=Methylobacterium longum TaxID=767694 RepID=A0ABT8AWN0_9HYPH|nr:MULTISPECIES: hypothetical protein [Methylobacterium]MCJ2102594.1 hypothetical protein [Methylobacterium sp. E-046]MDN3574373.1 hypothetical protein [Methylobacterium longum]GJE10327.1 hypothetical protein FOHLNKBM_1360 [Methylobacterium longum]